MTDETARPSSKNQLTTELRRLAALEDGWRKSFEVSELIDNYQPYGGIMRQAADEIERLRAALESIRLVSSGPHAIIIAEHALGMTADETTSTQPGGSK